MHGKTAIIIGNYPFLTFLFYGVFPLLYGVYPCFWIYRNPYLFIEVMDVGLHITFVSVRALLCCQKSISPQSDTCMYMLGSIISLMQKVVKLQQELRKCCFYESILAVRGLILINTP